MRRQDELIALFSRSDRVTRKYILWQAQDFSREFDGDELLDLLTDQLGGPDAVLTNQAVVGLARFHPGSVQRRYGLAPVAPGPLSATAARAIAALQPLAETLLQMEWEPTTASGAMVYVMLRRLASGPLQERLTGAMERGATALPVMLAASGSGPGGVAPVMRRIREQWSTDPDVLLLLGAGSPAEVFETLTQVAPRTALLGRLNLATVLDRLPAEAVPAAVGALQAAGEPWVSVFCLHALDLIGDPAHVQLVEPLLEGTTHEFVRGQAIRALGGMAAPRSVERCTSMLADPSPRIQAQALESLVRLGCPRAEMARLPTALTQSSSLRVQLQALLAGLEPGGPAPAPIAALIESADAVERLEAVCALGQLASEGAIGTLVAVAGRDPSLPVRLQALKSLSSFRSGDAIHALIGRVENGSPVEAITAARVLTRHEGDSALLACEMLLRAFGAGAEAPVRTLLYPVLGGLARRVDAADAHALIERALHEEEGPVLSAALTAAALSWSHRPPAVSGRLGSLARGADPRQQPRAALALFLGGEAGAVESLTVLAGMDDHEVLTSLLEISIDMTHLVERFDATHFPSLDASLAAWDPLEAPPGAVARASRPPPARPSRETLRRIEAQLRQTHVAPADESGFHRRLMRHTTQIAESEMPSLAAVRPARSNRWRIALGAGILLGCGIAFALLRGSPPPVPLELTVSAVESEVVDPRGARIEMGALLAPGQQVLTRARSGCTIVSKSGARLEMGPDQSVAVEKKSGAAGLVLAISPGEWSCELGGDDRLELRLGLQSFRGVGASFTLEQYQGRALLTVGAGHLTHVGADGITRRIEPGESRVIE